MTIVNTKIILITDNPSISSPIVDVIKQNGWELIEASDVKQAEQLLLRGNSVNAPQKAADVILISNPQRGDRQAATRAIKEGSFDGIPTVMLLNEGQKVYGNTKKKIAGTINIKPLAFNSSVIDPQEIQQVIGGIMESDNKLEIDDKSQVSVEENSANIDPSIAKRIIKEKERATIGKTKFTDRISRGTSSGLSRGDS